MRRFLIVFAIMALAIPLMATSVRFVSNEESVRLSNVILMGNVTGVESVYDKEGQILTNITIQVKETLKGNITPGKDFTFQAWGGSKDGVIDTAVGEARYNIGEKILVQLENIEGSYHTLGLSFGKWNVMQDAAGKEILRRDLSGLAVVDSRNSPVQLEMKLQQMRDLVRQVAKENVIQ